MGLLGSANGIGIPKHGAERMHGGRRGVFWASSSTDRMLVPNFDELVEFDFGALFMEGNLCPGSDNTPNIYSTYSIVPQFSGPVHILSNHLSGPSTVGRSRNNELCDGGA